MFSWLEYEILGMSRTDYLVLFWVLAVGLLILLYYGFFAFKRFRFMDATATSKIRSAAQGHVELKGLGEFMQNDVIVSPFSGDRCLWYHCTIDKKRRSGKRTTWTSISNETSSHLFRMVDETGECIIDPDHAQVIPETDQTWYGRSTEYRSQRPPKKTLISLGIGDYRFRERLIRPATPLYALGWFRTVHSEPSDEYVSRQVEELVRQWKLQPQRYLSDFDLDQNGKIQQGEWKAVRAAARKQVLAKIHSQKREHHVLSRPEDKRHPYIISALEEELLVTRKKLKAYASVTTAFLLFSALVFMSSVRPPLPV
ncbi:MAG: hypothetical protein JSW45_01450 [Thiotrichales bacterium]|nr:MAG: hypothetical protein JSW45_01450 [Thiotrichales bacterium]